MMHIKCTYPCIGDDLKHQITETMATKLAAPLIKNEKHEITHLNAGGGEYVDCFPDFT